ncbi:hypothetical protein G3A39_38445 [Paraburkholderia aspalathi]|nr:hypothetical protein [Paraburkholderia aspalathi]
MNLKGIDTHNLHILNEICDTIKTERGDRVYELFRCSVGRILANSIRQTSTKFPSSVHSWGAWYADFVLESENAVHIADWLESAVIEGDKWLNNIDHLGRPKKLMKCSAIIDLVREADKAMAIKNTFKTLPLGEGHEIIVATLQDGYAVVEMKTPEALDYESRRMKHCIGHGAYDRNLIEESHYYYSLRDPKGHPVATIETKRGSRAVYWDSILQVHGPRNARVTSELLDILRPWFFDQHFLKIGNYFDDVYMDTNTRYHILPNLKSGCKFNNLWIKADIVIPKNTTVLDFLHIDARFMTETLVLPESLIIGKRIYGSDQESLYLDEDLEVGEFITLGGDIYIDEISKVVVPDHLRHQVRIFNPDVLVIDSDMPEFDDPRDRAEYLIKRARDESVPLDELDDPNMPKAF